MHVGDSEKVKTKVNNKPFEIKNILSFVLKDFKSFSSLSDFGSLFHSKGAAT